MLAKKNRLPVQDALLRHGRIVRKAAFTIKIFSPLFSYSRFGVVVGKRVAKLAVGRNKIRRMAFNAIEANWSTWPVADYLIITHPRASAYLANQWHDELIPFSLN